MTLPQDGTALRKSPVIGRLSLDELDARVRAIQRLAARPRKRARAPRKQKSVRLRSPHSDRNRMKE
jgi:hypothetical protein